MHKHLTIICLDKILMMGQLLNVMIFTLFWTSKAVTRKDKPWGVEYKGEYCDYDVFKAECTPGHIIMVQSAVFGHMEIGKCIQTDLGYLGCKANVIDVLDARCSGKQSCQIRADDESLRDFKPCIAGIQVYLDATYTCVKQLASNMLCNMMQATSRPLFISSIQIFNRRCSSEAGLKIKSAKGQSIEINVQNLSPPDVMQTQGEIGYIIDGDNSDTMSITLPNEGSLNTGTSQSDTITIMFPEAFTRLKFLVEVRAIGCPDIESPVGTDFNRDGDVARVVCSYTQVSWKLDCRNGRWLGVIGNCTMPAPITTTQLPERTTPVQELALGKDVIYLIIICATIFLSVFVITVGCVILKRARILQPQRQKGENEWDQGTTKMILLPKPRPSSDYLTPRFNPDGESQQTAIYDTPLPDPPLVNTGNRPTLKRNNEEEFNNTMSSNSTDYTRKYFVLDQDYMNTKNLMDA